MIRDTVQWDFTVDSIPLAQSPSIELSRSTIDIGAGGKASLSAAAYGGSGNHTQHAAARREHRPDQRHCPG